MVVTVVQDSSFSVGLEKKILGMGSQILKIQDLEFCTNLWIILGKVMRTN